MGTERIALVTGASAGIGREIVKLLARDGYQVVAVARRSAQLTELATLVANELGALPNGEPRVRPLVADLEDPVAPTQIFTAVPSVDLLVNNAGFGHHEPFATAKAEPTFGMVKVNVQALLELTHLYVPGMVERGSGRILNVASTAAFQAVPYMSVYGATKAFVLSFSEGLAHELRGTGVTVTTLCPGATASEFQEVANLRESKAVASNVATAAAVAECGVTAMNRGRTVVVQGLNNKITVFLGRFMPRAALRALVGYLFKPRAKTSWSHVNPS